MYETDESIRDWSIFGIGLDCSTMVLVVFLDGKATPSEYSADHCITENALAVPGTCACSAFRSVRSLWSLTHGLWMSDAILNLYEMWSTRFLPERI